MIMHLLRVCVYVCATLTFSSLFSTASAAAVQTGTAAEPTACTSAERLANPALCAVDSGGKVLYTYDSLGRLTRVEYPSNSATFDYTYDAAGNRTEHRVDAVVLNRIRLWNAVVIEGGQLCFGVYRTNPSLDEITVQVETFEIDIANGELAPPRAGRNGTVPSYTVDNLAVEGIDYRKTSGSLTIPASSVGAIGGATGNSNFCVATLPDGVLEAPIKYVFARITSVSGGVADPSRDVAFGRIRDIDGDQGVEFTVRGASLEEPEAGASDTLMKFSVA
ncbi:MAG: RHS repeat protein, partial [Kordiimonadaceae bacterium]|nr:RHS repeat protein [Kordiimonadaceae bacterium]